MMPMPVKRSPDPGSYLLVGGRAEGQYKFKGEHKLANSRTIFLMALFYEWDLKELRKSHDCPFRLKTISLNPLP